jgi:hypothetical protein
MGEPIHATVGCVFSSDDAAIAALRAISAAGLVTEWRVGAADKDRAAKIARTVGGAADLDPTDPLSGVSGVASGNSASSGVNSGATIGGIVGAAAGVAIGYTPMASIMPVDPSFRSVAAALLFFAIGASVGGVLGGALGKQQSTHAGFRLIDAMEDGNIAVIGSISVSQADDVRLALEKNSASDIVMIAKETG